MKDLNHGMNLTQNKLASEKITAQGKAEDFETSLEKLVYKTPLKGYVRVMIQHSWRVRGSHLGQISVLENFESTLTGWKDGWPS